MTNMRRVQEHRVYKELNKQIMTCEDDEELKLWSKDLAEMAEAKQKHIDNKREELKRMKRMHELILDKENFKKVNPEWKYEELDEYWEMKLANQKEHAEVSERQVERDIESSIGEKEVYEKLKVKAKALARGK